MTQAQQILAELQSRRDRSGPLLTAREAIQLFDCYRLAARVNDLRDEGHLITTIMMKSDSGRRFAGYQLQRLPQEGLFDQRQ